MVFPILGSVIGAVIYDMSSKGKKGDKSKKTQEEKDQEERERVERSMNATQEIGFKLMKLLAF